MHKFVMSDPECKVENSLNKFPTIPLYNLKIILMGGFIAQSYLFIISTFY